MSRRCGHHGPAPSHSSHRGRAVPPRERPHRGRPPDDPQLPEHVAAMKADASSNSSANSDPAADPGRCRLSRARGPQCSGCRSGSGRTGFSCAAPAIRSLIPGPRPLALRRPIAIVPLDSTHPGAAAAVTGALEVIAGQGHHRRQRHRYLRLRPPPTLSCRIAAPCASAPPPPSSWPPTPASPRAKSPA